MVLEPGSIFSCRYLRWHHDSNPLLFVIYSDIKYTIGFNIHYLRKSELEDLIKLFTKIKNDPKTKRMFFNRNREWYYSWLKKEFPDLIESSYRVYFSGLLNGIRVNRLLRDNEIGSKWREARKGKEGEKKEAIRRKATRDDRVSLLDKKLKNNSFTGNRIKLIRKAITGK